MEAVDDGRCTADLFFERRSDDGGFGLVSLSPSKQMSCDVRGLVQLKTTSRGDSSSQPTSSDWRSMCGGTSSRVGEGSSRSKPRDCNAVASTTSSGATSSTEQAAMLDCCLPASE